MIRAISFIVFLSFCMQTLYANEIEPKSKNQTFNIYITNWEPFTIHKKDEVEGISVDIWELISKRAGIKYNYIKDENFAQALEFIKKDSKGMIIATSSTKERELYGSFTKPIISFPVSIATNIDQDFIIDLKELEGKTVAVGKNYTAHALLKKHYPKIKFVPVDDTIKALDLLARQKVYAAADILPVLIYNMNKYNFTNLKISGTSEFKFDVKFMINKNSEDIIPLINKYIDSVTIQEKQKIQNKWIYTREITKVDYTAVYILGIVSLVIISFMFYRQKVQKDNEIKIQNEKIKYKSILDLASDGVHIVDLNGNLKEYSTSFADMLGYEYKQLASLNVKDWDISIPKDQIVGTIKSLVVAPSTFETKHKRKDGTIIDVQISAKGIDIGGNTYVYASARDITQSKLKEKQLQDSEFRWKFAIEGNGDGLWDWNLQTNEVFFSPQWKKMLGFRDDEIEASLDEWEKRVNPEHLQAAHKDILDHIEGRTEIYKNEHQVLCKSGKYKWILDRGIVVKRDKDGKPLRMIGTHTDIDDLKRIQKLLADQKQEFETIFRYSKDGIAIVDIKTKFLKFNDAFLKLTGYTNEELLNKTSLELTAPEDIEFTHNVLDDIIKTGKASTYEKTFIFKDNKRVSLNISLSLLPDKQRLLVVAKDVTTLRILEDQSKLIAMGEMIGNIAHQWRQPLSIISTTATSMKIKLEIGKELDKDSINLVVDKIVDQTKYLSKTIDDFRNFIKDDKEYANIDLKDVIVGSLNLVEAVFKNSYIEVVSDIEDNLEIFGNKNELQQAFINIFNNAKDVLNEKYRGDEQKLLFISTKVIDNDTIELKILDNAGGISEDILKRIFEPYFTTKHKSVGTGLGLSMVDKIIRERHGYHIEVHNEEFKYKNKSYKGASFSILFSR